MSLLLFSKIAWASGVIAWFVMRLPFQRKARRMKVSDARHRNARDMTLLTISSTGLGIIPAVYALSYQASLPAGGGRRPVAVLVHPSGAGALETV